MQNVGASNPIKRWWDIPAALLLVVVLTTTFSRLIATSWTQHLAITRLITFSGLLLGLALGYSRFSPRVAGFFTIAYGLFVLPWRVGLTLGEGILWQERLLSLAGRLGTIVKHLIERTAVPDNLLFLVIMGFVFWILSVHAGYSLVRYGNPWGVILPSGITLVLIHSYDAYLASRNWYLVIYLLFALMLVARLEFLHNRQRWLTAKAYIPPYLGIDFIRYTLAIIIGLLFLAWTTPALADTLPIAADTWQRIKQPWNDVRSTFDNAFASLRSTIGIVTDFYGPNLLLGQGQPLSDSAVFMVNTPSEPPDGVRFYWRARVYDELNHGWSSTLDSTRSLEPDDFTLSFPDMADNAPGEFLFTFTLGNPIATIFAPNQPVWVSRPVKAEFAINPDGRADISSLRATPPMRAGESYQVRASFNRVSISQLRQAGTDYPDWVTERYLQLPDTITPRTVALARALAEGKDNPYDIASSITSYLRRTIEYSLTVPPIPQDRDVVDWFLFDYQKGFCNYYATSEIVLLRSLGIPARLAVGYAQGEISDQPDTYIIRQRDSHAWPEVYFPGIGWVEFEPTVSQPPLLRPLGERLLNNQLEGDRDQLQNNPESDTNLPEDLRGEIEGAGAINTSDTNRVQITLAISSILIIALVALTIPLIRKKKLFARLPQIPIALEKGVRRVGLQPPAFLRLWAHRASLSPVMRAYLEVSLALQRLGKRPKTDATPAERTSTLVDEIPSLEGPAYTLLDIYQLSTYSQRPVDDINPARAASNHIKWASIQTFFLQKLERFRRRWDTF